MRFVQVILTLYMLCLTLLPCNDDQCMDAEPGMTFVQQQHTDNCADDVCSPLCNCSCCGYHGFQVELKDPSIASSFVHTLPTFTFYKSPFVKDICTDFWQPPRIA